MTARGLAVGLCVFSSMAGLAGPSRGGEETPVAGVDSVTFADSLARIDMLADEGPTDDALSEALSQYESPGGRMDAHIVMGFRWEARARLDARRWSAAFRADEVGAVGYARYTGTGLVRGLMVGTMRLRLGEALVLGRSIGSYPPASRPGTGGLISSPSVSKTFGLFGASTHLAVGPLRGGVALVRGPVHDGPGPTSLWLSAAAERGGGSVGVTVGRRVGDPEPVATVERVVSADAAVTGPGYDMSLEATIVGSHAPFMAVRLRTGSRPRCRLVIFRAPKFRSTDQPALTLTAKPEVAIGVDTQASARVGPMWVSLAAHSRVDHIADGDRTSRYLSLDLRRRYRGRWSWEVGVRTRRDGGFSSSREAAVDIVTARRTSTSRVRGVLRFDGDGRSSHIVRSDYYPSLDGRGGILLSAGSDIFWRRWQLSWRVSAYDVPTGYRGFIGRPGIGPFEQVRTVVGRGSDVALRIRFWVTNGLELSGFCGAGSSVPPRAYLSLACKRR